MVTVKSAATRGPQPSVPSRPSSARSSIINDQQMLQARIGTVMVVNIMVSGVGAFLAYSGYKLIVLQSKRITQEQVMPMLGGYFVGTGVSMMVSGVVSCIMGQLALYMVDDN